MSRPWPPLIETHISYVLLAGAFAYKIKKAVRFDFLDFTTLSQRRFFCQEELRLNRRLAPAIYLDVVPITGTPDAPVLGGDGVALDTPSRCGSSIRPGCCRASSSVTS